MKQFILKSLLFTFIFFGGGIIAYFVIHARQTNNPNLTDPDSSALYVTNNETLTAAKRNSLVEDSNSFGTFESKTLNTVYQAPSDGFVYVYGANNALVFSSGTTATPTTQFGGVQANTSNAARYSMMVPIKKGYYWKVYNYAGSGTPVIRRIPFE